MTVESSQFDHLTTDEKALLSAYRRCTPQYRRDLYRLCFTAAMRCVAAKVGNVIKLKYLKP